MRCKQPSRRWLAAVAAALLLAGMAALPSAAAPIRAHRAAVGGALVRAHRAAAGNDGLGIAPGKIKHVWLIILENKSYDATFTGLNRNTYLWQTLPSQGVLLKNYYGTGHYSFDNYITLASGQATQADTQVDCPYYDHFSGRVDLSGSLRTNPNYGQMTSAQGPNAAAGANGCVYPASVKTLFDQFDAAGVSWKGYAQDLNYPNGSPPQHSAGARYCGAPYPNPGPTGSTAQPNPSTATATNQYLPKHFPFPWFESLRRAGKCNANHIADLFSPRGGLVHDLKRAKATPTFSWITPNMCSDGHDAVCHGNNLSGGFSGPNRPRPPRNYTGGLYAADLFLRHIVPEIERSRAYRDGGLIDITFDEAFPPFTFTGNSFANSKRVPPTAATSIANDTAGETLFGRAVHFEPTGPNTPLAKNSSGQELYPGPGNNAFVDRPANCVAQTVPKQSKGTCLLGGGSNVPGPRTDASGTASAGSTTIADNAAVITDEGRSVSGVGIPAGAFVGQVVNTPVIATQPDQNGGFVVAGSFGLVNASGQPLATTAVVHGVTLGPRTPASDPLFDATHATNGGGDTGSVLISPFIKPGSVSRRYYNHYGWLRTMEDLFRVGRKSKGLDGKGHLGYAAQRGLAPFGSDVFNRRLGRRGSAKRGLPRTTAVGSSSAPRAPAVGHVLRASPGHPALGIQGDTVAAKLPAGRVRATAIGPAVPPISPLSGASTARATFTVTLSAPSETVPVSDAGAFTIVDELGQIHHPTVEPSTATVWPLRVRPGHPVTLTISAVLPVGGGRLVWAPSRSRTAAAWDFALETD
jgi:Phosphoesterase family